MSANVSPPNSGDIIKCQIDMYNMTTKEIKTIYRSPLKICYQSLMVNTDWILWSDRGNAFSNSKVYVQNRHTEKYKLITKPDESSFIIPFLYKDYAAWIDDTNKSVVLYNLKTDVLILYSKIPSGF